MQNSLYVGANGMAAQQTYINTISNNLANVNTPAYKKSRVSFQDMVLQLQDRADASASSDLQRSSGAGSVALMLGKQFTVGQLKKTDVPTDLAINGDGLVELVMPDGSTAYTRNLSLQVTRDGLLANADGYPLHQQIQVPLEATAMQIDATGKVMVTVPNEKAAVEAGQIELVRFVNPAGLAPMGDSLYGGSEKAGDPLRGKPGEAGFGLLSQGYVEASNVQLVEEMVGLMLAQRAYEINGKVIQASDEMLGIVNGLRR
ncbi:flagellar basal-body rod protein FlgG [Noviherbaspirillum suwonense]|uniref:Flagellar basal-body rod protein FlgG n=1 Tax=Noviherbaspirillum suwonense TaxID=1224511 RepID=A0ABY1QM31_9BURK|nr:flagellar basal-body rod protein FlgG [Noviherbaspirillum suwonense]SMP74789.1 flagellar basal-body rod protein FlgG [Noviherbaspirillum suwonense]